MPLYRCTSCQAEFPADRPVCAACEVDPAKDPRHAGVVLELVTIHYDPPTRIAGRGQNAAACNPRLQVGTTKDRFTGEKDVVNCPACRASEPYRQTDTPPALPTDAIRFGPVVAVS